MTKQKALFNYVLRLADNNLILGHRLSENCAHGPMLEEDIATTNIALDLIGLANSLLQYAGRVEGKGRSEDDLAFLRNEREFTNSLLSEQPNTDFAYLIMRQFLSDAFDFHFYGELTKSKDEILSALAVKAHKEITYHLRHSSSWVERLGDGTEESHRRIQAALNELWRFTEELFDMNEIDAVLIKEAIAIDLAPLKTKWQNTVGDLLKKATLSIPANTWQQHGSRDGKHTEHLGYLLAEMQHLHRAHPGVTW